MKKVIFFMLFLLFSSVLYAFNSSVSNTRIAFGIGNLVQYNESDTSDVLRNFGVTFETCLKVVEGSSLSGSVDFSCNFYKHYYALSLWAKYYPVYDTLEGLFFGVSPLSECNLGDLFQGNPSLYWAVGIALGHNFVLFNVLDCEVKVVLNASLIDMTGKLGIACSLGYRF